MAQVVYSSTQCRSFKEKLKQISVNSGNPIVVVACALVFFTFTFCYLYFYQAESLSYLQYTLSEGKTHYERTIGAIIITVVLQLVQYWTARITKLSKRGYALTYFPSILGLTILTAVTESGYVSGMWLWLAPLLLAVFAGLAWIFKQLEAYEPGHEIPGLFSRTTWVNMLTMAGMFLFLTMLCNGDEVLHNRLKMEQLAYKGKYEEALKLGEKSLESDCSLEMLRAYNLARVGKLGESFFHFPVTGGKEILLPNGITTKTLMLNEKIIKAFSQKKGRADYLLMGYLLDRDLEGFACKIGKYYDTDSTAIPRHYREALVLYTHLKSNRVLTYHDDVLDADYEDMKALERKFLDRAQRATAVRDTYGNTYWYYYSKRD